MGSISYEKAAFFPEIGGFSLKIAGNLLEIAIRLKPARGAMASIEPGEGKNVSKTRAGKRRGCGSVGMVDVVSGVGGVLLGGGREVS
jgi:hypothetical protein